MIAVANFGATIEASIGISSSTSCHARDNSPVPSGKTSGLIEARDLLEGIKGIKFVYFSRDDVVRHPLVQEIIDAYERNGQVGRAGNGK